MVKPITRAPSPGGTQSTASVARDISIIEEVKNHGFDVQVVDDVHVQLGSDYQEREEHPVSLTLRTRPVPTLPLEVGVDSVVPAYEDSDAPSCSDISSHASDSSYTTHVHTQTGYSEHSQRIETGGGGGGGGGALGGETLQLPSDSTDSIMTGIDSEHGKLSSGSARIDITQQGWGNTFAHGTAMVPLGPGYHVLTLIKWWNKLQISGIMRNSLGFVFMGLEFVFVLLLALKLDDVTERSPSTSKSWWLIITPVFIARGLDMIIGYFVFRHTRRRRLLLFAVAASSTTVLLFVLVILRVEGHISLPWNLIAIPAYVRIALANGRAAAFVRDTQQRFAQLTPAEAEQLDALDNRTLAQYYAYILRGISLLLLLWIVMVCTKLDGILRPSWWLVWIPMWCLLIGAVLYTLRWVVALVALSPGEANLEQKKTILRANIVVFFFITLPAATCNVMFVQQISGGHQRSWVSIFLPPLISLALITVMSAPGDIAMWRHWTLVREHTRISRVVANAAGVRRGEG